MNRKLLSRIRRCLEIYCDFCEENNFSHEDQDRLYEAKEVLKDVIEEEDAKEQLLAIKNVLTDKELCADAMVAEIGTIINEED